MIFTLNEQVAKLQDQNNGLNGKIQQLNNVVEKKKKEITELTRNVASLKRSASSSKDKTSSSGAKEFSINVVAAPTSKQSTVQKVVPDEVQLNDSNLLEVARKYKAR